jgi:hypothetical protein
MRKDKYPEINAKLLAKKVAEFDKIDGPRVGDFLRFPNGECCRIAKIDDEAFQLGNGGFFLYGKGGCEYSGGLYAVHPTGSLRPTGETKSGAIWFFNKDEPAENNGVDFSIEFRVFALRDEFKDSIKPGLYY